jgi:hypothetical protein
MSWIRNTSLKGDLSNNTTVNLPLCSLVNTLNLLIKTDQTDLAFIGDRIMGTILLPEGEVDRVSKEHPADPILV